MMPSPSGEMTTSTEWLYANSDDDSCRFVLGTRGERPLICLGVNPSTATPQKPDTTVSRVKGFALRNGFDSWVMLNLYPRRATDPNRIDKTADTALMRENLEHVEDVLSAMRRTEIWAAWGNLISTRPYFIHCLKEIHDVTARHSCRWVQFGDNTKAGHPRHPSRLAYGCRKTDFDIGMYLDAGRAD